MGVIANLIFESELYLYNRIYQNQHLKQGF